MTYLNKYISALHLLAILILFSVPFTACKKQDDFLNQKPNQALATITDLSGAQLLLRYEGLFTQNDPSVSEIASNDFYITPSFYNGRNSTEQNCYTWANQIWPAGGSGSDWTYPYQQVWYANTVLDALPTLKIASNQQTAFDQTKGAALFLRSIAFCNLLQVFSMPYDSASAATQLGIPLRLTSNLNAPSTRASEKDCYQQIINDLQQAAPLLPTSVPIPTQPTQAAAYGLLARVFLIMGNFSQALNFANSSLAQNSQLVDYNTITTPGTYSLLVNGFMAEDLYHTTHFPYGTLTTAYNAIVDSVLYGSYAANDLRKTICFIVQGGVPLFRGTYDNSDRYQYSGIATDEIYLIRAECYARSGNVSAAMADLNALLVKRWKTGTFIPYTASSADDALNQILQERRKELLYRGQRWIDLRRLNKDTRFAVTLTRTMNGTTYTLPPNDPRYAFPIPDNEISTSGIQQNPR